VRAVPPSAAAAAACTGLFSQNGCLL